MLWMVVRRMINLKLLIPGIIKKIYNKIYNYAFKVIKNIRLARELSSKSSKIENKVSYFIYSVNNAVYVN